MPSVCSSRFTTSARFWSVEPFSTSTTYGFSTPALMPAAVKRVAPLEGVAGARQVLRLGLGRVELQGRDQQQGDERQAGERRPGPAA